METKVSMKTIYLILVITIGLVGLGVGSTFAVFTATAEIVNPITLKSDLTYNDDVLDTVDITIGPGESRDANIGLYNEGGVAYFYYAVWYIYDGSDGDITFTRNAVGTVMPNGAIEGDAESIVGIKITNNTSNTVTITVGVATSKDDIVLPSYMRLVTYTESTTYSLTLSRDDSTSVTAIYYKINGSNTYEMTTDSNITLNVNSGSTYYYYGVPFAGHSMDSCTETSPCSGIMSGNVTKKLSSTVSTSDFYNVTVIRKLVGATESQLTRDAVNAGESFSYEFGTTVTNILTQYYFSTASCTNGQKITFSDGTSSGFKKFTISSVTANTTCTIVYTTTIPPSGGTATE